MEVLALVMHFLITLCILGGYLYTLAIGQPDETLKSLLMVIGGYWFGALGAQKLLKPKEGKTPTKKE